MNERAAKRLPPMMAALKAELEGGAFGDPTQARAVTAAAYAMHRRFETMLMEELRAACADRRGMGGMGGGGAPLTAASISRAAGLARLRLDMLYAADYAAAERLETAMAKTERLRWIGTGSREPLDLSSSSSSGGGGGGGSGGSSSSGSSSSSSSSSDDRGAGYGGNIADDPFSWPELTAALQQRAAGELQLRNLMGAAGVELSDARQQLRQELRQQGLDGSSIDAVRAEVALIRGAMSELAPGSAEAEALRAAPAAARAPLARFGAKVGDLQRRVAEASNALLYGHGATAAARDAYVVAYGCAKWTEEALAAVAGCSPLIEIGAGGGQWQRALRAPPHRADVLAFDNGAQQPVVPQMRGPVAPAEKGGGAEGAGEGAGGAEGAEGAGGTGGAGGGVRHGDESEVARHAGRTLFLCYPPPFSPMARECVRRYGGERLLYVGEGRHGANADGAFFDLLEEEWDVERVVELEPFPGNHERLFVLRRKKKQSGR